MTSKILIAYTTSSGSTTAVAKAIRDELSQSGTAVDLQQFEEVTDLSAYDAVIVGAPMILGWHKKAVKFVEQHQETLSRVPVAYFFTALNLTKPSQENINGVPITCDPTLAKAPQNPNKLSPKEKHGTPAGYLTPVLEKVPKVKPVSVGFFGGKLDYSQLSIFPKLFVKIIIRGQEGDFRNWEAIRTWAASLNSVLVR
ncbi:flavodoxin domain-containing protein [Chloroflexota bacterium]